MCTEVRTVHVVNSTQTNHQANQTPIHGHTWSITDLLICIPVIGLIILVVQWLFSSNETSIKKVDDRQQNLIQQKDSQEELIPSISRLRSSSIDIPMRKKVERPNSNVSDYSSDTDAKKDCFELPARKAFKEARHAQPLSKKEKDEIQKAEGEIRSRTQKIDQLLASNPKGISEIVKANSDWFKTLPSHVTQSQKVQDFARRNVSLETSAHLLNADLQSFDNELFSF